MFESGSVQEAPGADFNGDNRGSVPTGRACLLKAGIAGLLSCHGFINGSLEGEGEFHKVYCVGGPENDVWPLVCGGDVLGKCIAVSREICCDVPAGRQVVSKEGVDGLENIVVSFIVPPGL